jgi:hypothetical protein
MRLVGELIANRAKCGDCHGDLFPQQRISSERALGGTTCSMAEVSRREIVADREF